jgi:PAS domain S-box-containing protein
MILAEMGFFKTLIESGVSYCNSKSERRNVLLSNYISVVISIAPIILLSARFITGTFEMSNSIYLIALCCVVFALPLLFNHFGFVLFSRLLLSWAPNLCVVAVVVYGLQNGGNHEISNFVGVQFFLLGFSCIPFLLFDVRNPKLLIAGLIGSLFPLVFFDYILDWFHVAYWHFDLTDSSYKLNKVRIFISLGIIGFGFYFLKRISEKNEDLNEKLIKELEEKNDFIKKQAANEVHQLNDQLITNLEQLSEREFILNQSQRIAKIGSWEYRLEGDSLFWSDEMYAIFGLSKSFNVKTSNLSEAIGKEGADHLTNAISNVMQTGNLFDITIRTKTPIGYVKWFRVYAYPIAERYVTIGVRGICHDVTFFKEAEEKLRAGEAKFSKVFDNYPDFIMVVREFDLMVVDVNPKITSVLGFEKQEVIGRSSRSMDLFLDEKERESFIRSYLIDGYSQYECPMKRKDGRIIQVKITGIRISIDGQFYRMSVIQDITEQRAAKEKFLKAFDLSPDLMLIFRERDLVVVEANKKIQQVTGFAREEVINLSTQLKGFELWAKPEEREIFFSTYQAQGSVFMEAELRKKNNDVFDATVSAERISLSDENHMIVVVRDITWRKQAEKEKEHARYQLNERIKELTTLYRTSQILHDEQKSFHEMFQEIVSIVPLGWQHSNIAAARIQVDGEEYFSSNFTNPKHKQQAEFQIPPGKTGIIEVIYTEDRPTETEGPFMAEERNLLNMIAEMLGEYLARKYEEESLANAQANLKATINNTEVLIWSVDRQFKLITFNTPFFEYIKKYYGVEPTIGERVFEPLDDDETRKIKSRWKENYTRALAGEIVTLDETRFGFDFQYSLSPIIENNMVTGVSIFADNVTERKTQDRELAEANKKIGELKLMALRSVMSPHFIFNVLNSIQFFIAKNDRVNAITYLSTFSKLIRSILTHSVDNKIKLTDEIDMLKNYIQLEMVRFENKFSFTLNIDPEVDVEAIEIPSLLIQPYVENAILHGLYNKVGTGTLKIDIYEENDTVIFQIEDDGIGREAAMKLREQNFPSHKSMGIKLTEERLQLINQKSNVVFEVHDLTNGAGPSGTRVRIGVIY